MKYNFDETVQRTYSAKWLEMDNRFGTNDLLPFWFADMDFKSPQPVIEALGKRVEEGIYGYTYRPESYFEAIQNWFFVHHNWKIDKESMVFSPGLIAAISILIREITEPGDKIIVQTPVYPPFYDAVTKNGRILIENPLKEVNGRYEMDYDDLEKKIDKDVKLMLLCSPHNPVGRVWYREELEKLGQICFKNNIRIISDEVHADIVYKPNKHIPIASISDEFKQNCITCIAANKTFNMAGLQGASAIIPDKADRDKFDSALGTLDIKRNNVFSVVATETAYRYGGEWYQQLMEYLTENFRIFNDYFKNDPYGVKLTKADGTYLMWLDIRELGLTQQEINEKIIYKGKIALDYGIRYGNTYGGFLRMSIGNTRSLLNQGLERLDYALSQLQK